MDPTPETREISAPALTSTSHIVMDDLSSTTRPSSSGTQSSGANTEITNEKMDIVVLGDGHDTQIKKEALPAADTSSISAPSIDHNSSKFNTTAMASNPTSSHSLEGHQVANPAPDVEPAAPLDHQPSHLMTIIPNPPQESLTSETTSSVTKPLPAQPVHTTIERDPQSNATTQQISNSQTQISATSGDNDIFSVYDGVSWGKIRKPTVKLKEFVLGEPKPQKIIGDSYSPPKTAST
ncbi:hypothetical protein HK102_013933, partial [Quaeritorhiza haematococci]